MSSANAPSEPLRALDDVLLSAHLAEYQALTTRTTYRLTLQFALWPILLIALTLLSTAREIFGLSGVMWTGATVVQLVLIQYYAVILDVYTDVQYIETQLRPTMEAILGDRPFWRYEHFLREHRGFAPVYWEYWPIALGLAAVAFAAYSTFRWSGRDYVGLIVNSIMLGFEVRLAHKGARLRENMLGAV